jgi:alkanesulfonate monooxygenase SsuD/methylene tetrahydromethanopterin reductase-like flavin-dependent oxidoreductase (luciferase family)
MPDTPLHVGLTPWRLGEEHTARTLVQQAELAESLGFASLWLPENHFTGRGALPEPLLLLAAVAARTRQLRLGTTSLLLPVRHPVQAAEQVAVLDHLCEGRLILGLGRGYQDATFKVFDVPLAQKRDRFEECLARMQQAWRGEPLDAASGAVLAPLPHQRPHPPIWLAAFGPKALAQAGRLGFPYLASPRETRSTLRLNQARWRRAALAARHQPSAVVPVMRTTFVCEDASVLADVRDRLARQPPAAGAGADGVDDWALVGSPEQVAAGIARYRAELGMTHLIATRPRLTGLDERAITRSLELLMHVCRTTAGPAGVDYGTT